MNPLVSVVIPVYRGGTYLAEAIESVLAQTYDNIELLVVNDGSDDKGETRAVASKYKESIRYFEKENGGVSTALNLGIKEMRGEYFSWLSHDDLYYPEKIEKQVIFLKKHVSEQPRIVYSDFDVIDEKNVLRGAYRINTRCACNAMIPVMFGFLNGCTMLIPAVCFEHIGLFNEEFRTTQDYDMWFRMAKIFNFIHVPVTAVKSREHNTQISKLDSKRHNFEADKLYKGFIDQLSDEEIRKLGGKSFTDKLNLALTSLGHKGASEHLAHRIGHNPSHLTTFFYGRIYTGWMNHYNIFSVIFNPIFFLQKILLKVKILCQKQL